MCQVRRHNKMEDCWLTAHGKVYNASGFMMSHPAGYKPILKKAGKDCTVDFDFHSPHARKTTWEPLLVGKLVRCQLKDPPSSNCVVM